MTTTKITVDARAWVRDGQEWVLWKQAVEVGDLTDIADMERRVYAAVRASYPNAQFIDSISAMPHIELGT